MSANMGKHMLDGPSTEKPVALVIGNAAYDGPIPQAESLQPQQPDCIGLLKELQAAVQRIETRAAVSANMGKHMPDGPSTEKRVALVIGNAAYVHLGELENPTNDAQDISRALEGLDFSVATGVNLSRDPMENAFFEFETAMRDADVALLFYSGHGLQVKGENYLIPVDAKIEMEMHLKRRAFSLSEILAVMGARTKTNIIFLDACRNNPFGSEPSRAIGLEGERALRRGLAQVEKAQGIFIAFAAAANEVALDGVGRNSRFTAALLKHIHTPGLSIADMMMDVSNTVAVETFDRQQPWQQSNLRAKFFFRPLEAASDKTADVEVAEQAQKERIETKKAVEHDQDIAQPDHARWASVLRAFKGWAPSATKVAGIAAAIGLLAYVAGGHLNFFVGFGIPVLLLIGFLIVLFLYIPQTYEISEYLILAEREMNSLLRAWGGGLSADARKAIAKERIDMAKAVGTPEALQQAFDLNISDLYGGPRAAAMGRARFTAFLLREIYEGNVRNAQRKIFNEVANGNNPYIAPGVRQIVGYDRFDKHDIKNNGFPPDAGVDWFPLWLTVKLNRYPRNIVMIRSDKSRVYNWDVIEELTGS